MPTDAYFCQKMVKKNNTQEEKDDQDGQGKISVGRALYEVVT
jgi:hypothetical protein